MSLEFRPGTEVDLPGIIALLRAAFEVPPHLDERLLRWRYFSPDRSYVMARDGEIVAHGCAWPVPKLNAICLIDWASAKSAPGMGIMLVRKMAQIAPVMLSLGGSEMTQLIMPKIGFVPRGQLLTYARVLRPWKQFRTRPNARSLRGIAQLGRNAAWSFAPLALTRNWRAVRGERAGDCPAAELRAFGLSQGGHANGEFVLSQVDRQARVARVNADAGNPAIWAAIIEAVQHDTEACELTALAHDPRTRRALQENGFQERGQRTVYVLDPGKTLSASRYPLPLDMLDDDMFYLNLPGHPYLT